MSAAVSPPAADAVPQERTRTIVGQGGVQTDSDLDNIGDPETADIIPDSLADYAADCNDWTAIAQEHWKQGRMDRAEESIRKGIEFFGGRSARGHDHQALLYSHTMSAHSQSALSRTAPKSSIPYAKYDKSDPKMRLKEAYYTEAATNLNRADQALSALGMTVADEPAILALGKIISCLARGQPNVAQPMVDRLLLRQPNNLIALTAQARSQFARRSHEAALQTYQKLSALAPEMTPDPRIGLGLCAWVLGDRKMARRAWERALSRDPNSWVSLLLLGLASSNQAREPSASREERLAFETEGIASVQRSFKLNNKSAAAALASASVSGQSGQSPLASKLAERAIQMADNRRHSASANAERGRSGFIAGDVADAGPFIAAAKSEEGAGVNILAELTLGQIAIKNGNLREALNFIEQTAKKLNGKGPLEYTVLHACLLAYPHPGMKDDEIAKNQSTARTMLTELHNLVASASTEEDFAKSRGVAQDADIFVDLARLWQDESLEKAIGAYQTAVSITSDESEDKPVDYRAIRLSSNLGTLYQLQGNVETAERMYQEASSKVASEEGNDAETVKTILAYNSARAYEEEGDIPKATQWYRDVLRQHPEHMESKVRSAMIAAAAGRNFDAHTLLKECSKADETNITLRSVYTNFLISIGSHKEASVFTSQTLKYDRYDAATFASLGWSHFASGREAKSSQELAGRTKEYSRSAEAYQRALDLDPKSAVAAQGLAIALAEDTSSIALSAVGSDEVKTRMRLAGQALTIFSRIADSSPSGAVNVNIGHCYFARGEEEKAIQAYEAASNHFKGKNVSVSLYSARAWYAYANSLTNFSAMSKALSYCQQAMHIQPSDRAILYNIAMISQKGAELILGLDPSKRTLEELKTAVEHAQQAANVFRGLADDRSGALPYDADLADQRARYGDGLLRRAPAEIEKQTAYEGEAQARVEEARRIREEEQRKLQEAEAARKKESEQKAAELEERRRIAREEAQKWQEELNQREQEEAERKAQAAEKRRKRKEEGEIDSADENGEPREKKPRKKKSGGGKKSRKVRSKSEISTDEEERARSDRAAEEEDEARDSGDERVKPEDEEAMRAAKAQNTLAMSRNKRKAKRSAGDDDEAANKRGKQFKSKEVIEDSDEEADDATPAERTPRPEGDETNDVSRATSPQEGTTREGTAENDRGDSDGEAALNRGSEAEKMDVDPSVGGDTTEDED